ncbi:16S rRNA (guanine(527)-N(7))-methyltransferase RsmG [Nocardioides sp. Root122]|uniref:16S rRNA (guanine(527)-N(7))-methyltransferase RsmG n=1 Tax=Nocardioides TaxID=1839 RepID=UPI0007032A18|nr:MULTISPECIES: 16S rRNA (guanine(527)-N(7))-methyltransferase RsmG [Nocardioides]KQV64211.1 16S rRNA (guanine(527)-N(7))-methyltransferase RsmG [Nocardioides sp. Root122]MCK9825167.1 16S rRNA (guanine(527)-N(7))-methyltransferase RsmG [Nocardioides cavernae]
MSDDVSRETPSVPEAARRVFASERLDLAARYTELLATEGVLRGLIGPREAPRLWERHVLNSAVLAEAIPADATVCDIGTGAGLPGLVVAIARPDLQMTLVEPLLRRTTFLDEVIAELGLSHVTVVRGRAEHLHGVSTFDVVTSRAVAPLVRLLGWSMPLVAPTGALMAMKGRSVQDEVEEAEEFLHRWRCGVPEVFEVGIGVADPPTTVVRVPWADPTQIGWPLARESKRRPSRRSRRAAQ